MDKGIEKGFYDNSYDIDERHYTWGSYIDLCGMEVKDAIPLSPCPCNGGGGGDTSGKTKNTITFSMMKNGSNEYELHLTATQAGDEDVNVSFSFNGDTYLITIPAGTATVNTELVGEDPSKPYATISDILIYSDSEKFTYKASNTVKTGVFVLTVIIDGVSNEHSLKYGTEFTLPEVEEREGYDFVWTDAEGNEITGSTYTMPEANTHIDGTYETKGYTLSYEISEETFEGGSVVTTTTTGSTNLLFGEKILPHLSSLAPEKEGHTLAGWQLNGGVLVTSATTMPASNVTAETSYALNQYVLAYLVDGAEFSKTNYYFGQPVTAETQEPAKTGYTFTGWDSEAPVTMPSHNVTINAEFTVNAYHIRYYIDSSLTYDEVHNYGSSITIRANEQREGYTFSGWDVTLPATMPANDIAVNGSFTINEYTLSCVAEGETIYSRSYEFGEAVDDSEIPVPTKEGFTFTNWSEEIPITMPANDVTLVANFAINQYNVEYYVDDSLYSSATLDYGAAINPIAEPSREGFTFSGWDSIPATVPANNVEINGTFSINQYTLTFTVDGSGYTAFTANYGTAVPEIAEPSREGYTFSGWDKEIPEYVPAENMEFLGYLNINSHTLYYNVDGELYTSAVYEYGEAIVPIETPSQEGHTFSGWTPSVPATMPDSDVTVYGTLNVNQYTLTFLVDGSTYTSITADYGTVVPAVANPTKTGYTFSGWTPSVPATIPAENMTFESNFVINSYTANYVIDGEPYSSVSYNYGAVIVYPDVPKSGYVLTWDEVYQTMPASNITINGTYSEISNAKTIYYDAILTSDESGITSVTGLSTVEVDLDVETPVTFTVPGNPEYTIAEEEYEQEEFDEWCAAHNYSLYFAIPTGTTYVFENGVGGDLTSKTYAVGSPIVVNGITYQGYAYNTQACCLATDTEYIYKIILRNS